MQIEQTLGVGESKNVFQRILVQHHTVTCATTSIALVVQAMQKAHVTKDAKLEQFTTLDRLHVSVKMTTQVNKKPEAMRFILDALVVVSTAGMKQSGSSVMPAVLVQTVEDQ